MSASGFVHVRWNFSSQTRGSTHCITESATAEKIDESAADASLIGDDRSFKQGRIAFIHDTPAHTRVRRIWLH
jgi:hypothetical protein